MANVRDPWIATPLHSSPLHVSIAVCAHCGGPVVTFASMCPRCGHRASNRGAVMIDGVPVYGSRRRGAFGRAARRVVAMLLVGAAVAGVFLLAHLSRKPSAHAVDDQEEHCRTIAETGEEYAGQLAACQAKLARLRVIEHGR